MATRKYKRETCQAKVAELEAVVRDCARRLGGSLGGAALSEARAELRAAERRLDEWKERLEDAAD